MKTKVSLFVALLAVFVFAPACKSGGEGGGNSNGGGTSDGGKTVSNEPSKLTIKSQSLNEPEVVLELEGKKSVVKTEKIKLGYGNDAVEVLAHKLIIANFDFDPKAKFVKPTKNGEILISIPLFAAKDATESTPIASGTYQPVEDRKNAAMKVGEIIVYYYKVENDVIKDKSFAIADMGIRNGSIKISSVSDVQIQGTIDDFGAGKFSNIKGVFNAAIVK